MKHLLLFFSFFILVPLLKAASIPMEADRFSEIVVLTSQDNFVKCTGVVVGPRVVLTSRICGDSFRFQVNGIEYEAESQEEDIFNKKFFDKLPIVYLKTDKVVEGVRYARLADSEISLIPGDELFYFTHGSSTDNVFRLNTQVFQEYMKGEYNTHILTTGESFEFGDSGSPLFVTKEGKNYIVGVSDMMSFDKTLNYSFWLLSMKGIFYTHFWSKFTELVICDVNRDC